MTPTSIAAYLALFTALAIAFLFVHLLIGRLVRPSNPNEEKQAIYECGEPTIGSSFVQFDIRFYVVALLFIIFDVEIAFFFPWANVFGKATHLRNPALYEVAAVATPEGVPPVAGLYSEMGVPVTDPVVTGPPAIGMDYARRLAWMAFWVITVFFGVLLIPFAYVWKMGDLDWVRAVSRQRAREVPRPPTSPRAPDEVPVLAG